MQIRSLTIAFVLFAAVYPQAYADLDDERDLGIKKPVPSPVAPPKPTGEGMGPLPNLGVPASPRPRPKEDQKPGTVLPRVTSPAAPAKPNTTGKDGQSHDSKQPINWSAKGLKGSKDAKIVDLLDDVVVTQGNVKLEANKAKVFFTEQDEVSKVEAAGNVKVTKSASLPQDRISARGNEAIFDNAKRTVTLIGRAALWRGGDVVRGKRIIYNLDTGWINVDSVEGVVQQGEQPQK